MDEIKALNIRIPYKLWESASMDKIKTGESINALIIRLLTDYYKDKIPAK